MSSIVPEGFIGNYIVVDNKIILNYLFKTGSDAALTITEGTKTIMINEDNTLTDNNQSLSIVNKKSITLEKDSENESKFKESSSLKEILNNNEVIKETESQTA